MVKNKKTKEKKDYFTNVMIVQGVVCAILAGIMIISFKTTGAFIKVIKEGYQKYMTSDFTDDDFSEAFRSVKNYIAVFAEQETPETITCLETEITEVSEEFSVIDEIPTGGVDVEFSALDTLEGVCFESVNTGIKMKLPLKEYRLSSLFGYRINPVSGLPGIHTGTDMAAAKGTSIYSVADGTVISAGWDDGYGNNIKILHENNVVTVYAHCSRLCAEKGDKIIQGEKIAEVGSTGNSTGNHLHFEIRKDNIKVNPELILSF